MKDQIVLVLITAATLVAWAYVSILNWERLGVSHTLLGMTMVVCYNAIKND